MTEPTGTSPDPAENPDQQQDPAPVTTPPATPPSNPTPPADNVPDGFVKQERFSGAIKKIEELTLANRGLNEQLTAKTSEMEQLNAQLASKDIEKTVAVGERDKNLEVALKKNADMEKELASLRAFKMKVETARELGHPELIGILDRIPAMEDADVLKDVMSDFVNFRESGIKEREQALLSGYTPPTPSVQPTDEAPQSNKEWEKHVNSLPVGSKDRQEAFDKWFDWQQEQRG